MVIALVLIWSYFSALKTQGTGEEKPKVTIAMIKEELERTSETQLPFGVSIIGSSFSEFPMISSSGEVFDIYSYGLKLDYQFSKYINFYTYLSESHISGIIDNNNITDHGTNYAIGGLFSYNYKNLYYAKSISLAHTHLKDNKSFNKFVYAPRLGYITTSRKFKFWGGLGFYYQDEHFYVNLKNGIFVPTIGMEYQPSSHLEFFAEYYLKEEFHGVSVSATYRF